MTVEQCWHRVPGGTASAALATIEAIRDRAEFDLVGVAARHRTPPAEPWEPGIPVGHLPLPRVALYQAWHVLRLPRVQVAVGGVDLIHATTLAVPPRSAPLVLTLHDLLFLRQPQHFTRRGLRLFRRGLDLARRDADIVLCSSRATLRDCVDAGFDPARVRLVPLGVEARPVAAEEIDAVRRRYGLQRRYVLWVGTIEPRKNLRRLLAAFASLDADVDLVLVGPKGWHEDVDALVRSRDRVRVMGFVPRATLRALYAGASVFCFPSLLEGFGLPVLEAMSQGVPVVTSKGTATEEIAGDAALLVDPTDTDEIRDAMRRVVEDEILARELADAARGRAGDYSWERTAELVAEAYREVLG